MYIYIYIYIYVIYNILLIFSVIYSSHDNASITTTTFKLKNVYLFNFNFITNNQAKSLIYYHLHPLNYFYPR